MMKQALTAVLFGLALGAPALAAGHDHNAHAMSSGQAADAAWSEGTVKKINAEAGKITISHGPLPKLDMPPMTMVFRVKDPAWLNQMKAGDRIRFVAERVDGALTVTAYEKQPVAGNH